MWTRFNTALLLSLRCWVFSSAPTKFCALTDAITAIPSCTDLELINITIKKRKHLHYVFACVITPLRLIVCIFNASAPGFRRLSMEVQDTACACECLKVKSNIKYERSSTGLLTPIFLHRRLHRVANVGVDLVDLFRVFRFFF